MMGKKSSSLLLRLVLVVLFLCSFCVTEVQSAFGIKLDSINNDDSKDDNDNTHETQQPLIVDANVNDNDNSVTDNNDTEVESTSTLIAEEESVKDEASKDNNYTVEDSSSSVGKEGGGGNDSDMDSNTNNENSNVNVNEGEQKQIGEEGTAVVTAASDEKEEKENVVTEEEVVKEDLPQTTETATTAVPEATTATEKQEENKQQQQSDQEEKQPIAQSGPFVDLFGDTLLSLEMVDETHAKLDTHYTNDALSGKKVIGLYFSADWCGPCRQFTPELVSFYDKINARKGDTFEIVWISRCRDVKAFGNYFTHMKWLALPPEEALGARGQMLSDKFKVKGIPHFVLLDELGSVITYNAREQIPKDKAGIGFPWRNPMATLYITFVPKTLRLIVKRHVEEVKDKVHAAVGNIMKKGK